MTQDHGHVRLLLRTPTSYRSNCCRARKWVECQDPLDIQPMPSLSCFPGSYRPHFGLTTTLNAAADCALLTSVSAGQSSDEQVAGTTVDIYESEGWGFDSHPQRTSLVTQLPGEPGSLEIFLKVKRLGMLPDQLQYRQ
jgi:hypothetical protein